MNLKNLSLSYLSVKQEGKVNSKVLYTVFGLTDLVRVVKTVQGVFRGQKGNRVW